ncbi:hypothetical protein ABW19_dt0207797 [Dactylella cylindrospora]|nr:hypothetical protein ABW19_dt0207797 [Dactylella cylindrospora]
MVSVAPPVPYSPSLYTHFPIQKPVSEGDSEAKTPIAGDSPSPQISWEEMQSKMLQAYTNQLDNGLLDCLLGQNPEYFIFFDVKYTHLGDYLHISMARIPAQVCLQDYQGNVIYQANLAMFNPHTEKELVCMHDWISLILSYLQSGEMSRRWYNEDRLKVDIETMKGYFSSEKTPRRTIQQMRQDLSRFDLRHNILFTHDGNLRTYDLLRKLTPEGKMPPRLLTMSSSKMIKMLLPDMPRDLYDFMTHLIDRTTMEVPNLKRHIASEDTTYIRQIFKFMIDSWRFFQQKEGTGRSMEDAPEKLVHVWEGFAPDSPLFEPISESEDSEDEGLTLEDVEQLEKWDGESRCTVLSKLVRVSKSDNKDSEDTGSGREGRNYPSLPPPQKHFSHPLNCVLCRDYTLHTV